MGFYLNKVILLNLTVKYNAISKQKAI